MAPNKAPTCFQTNSCGQYRANTEHGEKQRGEEDKTYIIRGDHEPEKRGIRISEAFDERWQRHQSAHHALVTSRSGCQYRYQ